ncbi:MAG: alpha/beta hydrolase, partial [Pyrinomonadaceae bacterium]|nr:alpha/beta hydrolase [Pyrinomonadaceae bacterium]
MSEALIDINSIQHGYAQIGGVRLHYAQYGSGERLVVLLHGFPECWYSWRHQLVALGQHYTVVAPDMRGYNLSDKPPRVEDYRLDLLADDVTGLIRHLGRKEAAIVGHDWGAGVAWAVASKHPEYVWRLAALQVPPLAVWLKNMTLKQALRSWYMLFFQIPRLPEWLISRNDFEAIDRMFAQTVMRPGTITQEDIAVYKKALREPGALTAGINYYRANFFSRFFPRGDKQKNAGKQMIRVPTLFIFGERDHAIVPETVRGVGEYIDAPYREVRLATAGHWVQQEAHAAVTAALISFFGTS